MSSRVFTSFAAAVVLSMVGVLGCSASPANSAEKDPVDSYESDLKLASPKYLGTIADGETKTSTYTDPPSYRALGFTATGGDEITVSVKSVDGDAMGWITTSGYTVLAANDDASSSTLDSKVVYKVPASTGSKSYRIVFRDYDLLDATFSVKLSVSGADAPPVTCTYDGATHKSGDSFASDDGCNTCSCGSTGKVSCTKAVCQCNPEAEPWRNYVGTPSTCETIRYSCAGNKQSFQNACGCGCELLSH